MLTIGKLAALANVTPDALRFYEREGLITPTAKSEGGYRLYSEAAQDRLRFVAHARQCGFSLAEIRELLTLQAQENACCDDVRSRAVQKKLQLESKIRAMKSMSRALDVLIADCSGGSWPVSECPILSALARAEEGSS